MKELRKRFLLVFVILLVVGISSSSVAKWNSYIVGAIAEVVPPLPGTVGQVVLGTQNEGSWATYSAIVLVDEDGNPGGATVAGVLNTFKIQASGAGNVWLKLFRDDGTNYVYVTGDIANRAVVLGLNSFTVDWPIQIGDLIGVYFVSEVARRSATAAANSCMYKSGNVTSTSLKTSWTVYDQRLALGGTIND